MARRVLLFVFLTVFLDLIGFGIILPLLPLYVKMMGGSAQTVGFLFASFSATQLVATPVLGRLSDRFGRRPVILVSLAGNALSMLVFALATKVVLLPLLFASRIVGGATAGNLAACQAAVADVTEGSDRARGMGRLGAGIGLGLVLGPVLGGWLSGIGPSAPALGAAALAVVDLTLAFMFMPETHTDRANTQKKTAAKSPFRDAAATGSGAPERTLIQVLADPRVLLVLLLYFLTFLAMTSLQVALALVSTARLAWSEREIGHLFGLYGLILLIVQGGLIGKITRAFGELNTVLAGTLFVAAGMLGISVMRSAPQLLAAMGCLGFGFGITLPVISSIATRYAGKQTQGAVLGFAQSSGGLARAVGPICAGFLYARVAPGAPFVAAAVAAGVSLLALLGLRSLR